MRIRADKIRTIQLGLIVLTASLLVAACGEDPIGPDNRMALLALGSCQHDQAMQLTENALERGNAENRYRALVIQAVILRDQGRTAEAEALYPAMAEAWEAVKLRSLSEQRRQRDLDLFAKVAQDERRARGLDPNCNTTAVQ